MKIGILGGGFGLYGYLPAAVQNDLEVVTLDRYRPMINNRPELQIYSSKIHFVNDEETLIQTCPQIVIARDTKSQAVILKKYAGKFKHIFLEKPLGVNAKMHSEILNTLLISKQSFSIGYLAPFTKWFHSINSTTPANVEVVWECSINQTSWKSRDFPDSGLFSFYGIHMVPIIQYLGMDLDSMQLRSSENSLELIFASNISRLQLKLINSGGSKFTLSNSVTNELLISETPFGVLGKFGLEDPRVHLLREYLSHNILGSNMQIFSEYEYTAIKVRELIQDKLY